jgi:type III pantothenate kinase
MVETTAVGAMTKEVWWAFDVGNTRAKAGIFQGDKLLETRSGMQPDQTWLETLARAGQPTGAAIATVNEPLSEELERLLDGWNLSRRLVLRSDGALLREGWLKSDVTTPTTIGIDRLLGMLAAVEQSPGHTLIVVDAGSAITVNLVTADRVFRGGAILPGLKLLTAALRRGTAALPEVAIDRVPPALGRSTEDAIASGITRAALGAIERLIDELRPLVVDVPGVMVTGGDGPMLSPHIARPHHLVPDLVLHGLARVALKTWQTSPPNP